MPEFVSLSGVGRAGCDAIDVENRREDTIIARAADFLLPRICGTAALRPIAPCQSARAR